MCESRLRQHSNVNFKLIKSAKPDLMKRLQL